MAQQDDTQAMLLKLNECLYEDDRCRISLAHCDEMQLRDSPTLSNSLSIIESFYDEAKISEVDLDLLIQLLREKDCHDAVNRLQEHKQSRQPNKESKSTRSGLVNVIYEDDKTKTCSFEQGSLLIEDNTYTSPLNEKENSFEKFHCQQSVIHEVDRSNLAKCIILLLVVILVIIAIIRKAPPCKEETEKILFMKRGDVFGEPGDEQLFDDAEIATLTFNSTITRVTAYQTVDLTGQLFLLSLTFTYSNNKKGKDYGGIGHPKPCENTSSLELHNGEYIDQVTVYDDYREVVNPGHRNNSTHIIVGIQIRINGNKEILFGSNNGTNNTESSKGYFLGYMQGKSSSYIDQLCCIWYRYGFENSTIIE